MSGVLVDSFDDHKEEFVPLVPELFLHAWIKKSGSNCLSDEPRRLLNQIQSCSDLKSCSDFFNEYVKIDNSKYCFLSSERNESTSKPKLLKNDFILLYVGQDKTNENMLADSPSNVMFCFGQHLQNLYGPTLMNFVDCLLPDETVSVCRRTIVTNTVSNQN